MTETTTKRLPTCNFKHHEQDQIIRSVLSYFKQSTGSGSWNELNMYMIPIFRKIKHTMLVHVHESLQKTVPCVAKKGTVCTTGSIRRIMRSTLGMMSLDKESTYPRRRVVLDVWISENYPTIADGLSAVEYKPVITISAKDLYILKHATADVKLMRDFIINNQLEHAFIDYATTFMATTSTI